MASANWMKATTQKAGAMKKHLGQYERENGNHSNEHIDKNLSPNNYTIGCKDFDEALERMKARTAEVDKIMPPKRVRKDRVTCCFVELPCPESIKQQGRSDEFFQQAFQTMKNYFGDKNVHGGFVHKDEVHEYIDKDGLKKMSLEHLHTLVSAYTDKNGINGKAFETRARLKAFNKSLDDMCKNKFGVSYNTGETPQGKAVETLKHISEQIEQKFKEFKEWTEKTEQAKKEAMSLILDEKKGLFESQENYKERQALHTREQLINKQLDEREQLIGERELRDDKREQALDEREQALDEREQALDEREQLQKQALTEQYNELEAKKAEFNRTVKAAQTQFENKKLLFNAEVHKSVQRELEKERGFQERRAEVIRQMESEYGEPKEAVAVVEQHLQKGR